MLFFKIKTTLGFFYYICARKCFILHIPKGMLLNQLPLQFNFRATLGRTTNFQYWAKPNIIRKANFWGENHRKDPQAHQCDFATSTVWVFLPPPSFTGNHQVPVVKSAQVNGSRTDPWELLPRSQWQAEIFFLYSPQFLMFSVLFHLHLLQTWAPLRSLSLLSGTTGGRFCFISTVTSRLTAGFCPLGNFIPIPQGMNPEVKASLAIIDS